MPDGPLGVALVGYGAIAERHAAALREARASLVTVHGPDPAAAARFAARHGFAATDPSLEAVLLRPDVEAVVIASPSAVHADQARAALEAGRHALVEIPLALSLAAATGLVRLAEERGAVLGVCHTLRFWEPYAALRRELAASGAAIRHVIARRLLERRTDHDESGRPRRWTDDLLWHHGGHTIDAVLSVLAIGGHTADRVASASGPPSGPAGAPMDHAIALGSAAGAVATIALSYHSQLTAADLMVVTDAETWHISGAELRRGVEVVVSGSIDAAHAAAIARQDAAFVAACRGGLPFPAAASSVLPTARIQQAVADGGSA